MKEIKDLIKYLEHIQTLQKNLSKEQEKDLANIIKVILILLVSLKKSSNLGQVRYSYN